MQAISVSEGDKTLKNVVVKTMEELEAMTNE